MQWILDTALFSTPPNIGSSPTHRRGQREGFPRLEPCSLKQGIRGRPPRSTDPNLPPISGAGKVRRQVDEPGIGR